MASELTDRPAPQVFHFRGQPVVMANEVAPLFGTEPKKLAQNISRNPEKFTEAYAFKLDRAEFKELRSQIVTSAGRGGLRHPPWMLTERGVILVGTVLRSPRAVEVTHYLVEVLIEARRAGLTPRVNSPEILPRAEDGLAGTRSRAGFSARLQRAMDAVLDDMLRPAEPTPAREEAEKLVRLGLDNIRARLKKPELEGEKIVAEVAKLLAETEAAHALAAKTRAETDQIRLAVLAKQLRLLIAADQALAADAPKALLETIAQIEDQSGD